MFIPGYGAEVLLLDCEQVRGALVGSVFRKMLRIDTATSSYSPGQLTNLMSVDAQSVLEYSCYTHFIWATSLQVKPVPEPAAASMTRREGVRPRRRSDETEANRFCVLFLLTPPQPR